MWRNEPISMRDCCDPEDRPRSQSADEALSSSSRSDVLTPSLWVTFSLNLLLEVSWDPLNVLMLVQFSCVHHSMVAQIMASKEAGQALVCKINPNFELQHHHLLNCLEKTTNHEFVDEKVFELSCRDLSPVKQLSSSSSISSSSPHGFFCCGHKIRKTFNIPNSNMSLGLQGSIQELSTIQIRERPITNSRASLNARFGETLPLNCEPPYLFPSVVSIPTPNTTPDGNRTSGSPDHRQANIVRVSAL
ncbi:hypothetical protein CCH79_00020819 [Gambusia affinis]|uniref:Potassium channel voltage dependent Kv4 C-terminal domain-containing protein n=1 Tax=Gambusia affinis TaxID=33528 RepID=A0A315UUZ4_GAMAF|nr:hypothetical protein CCH79_00020819 [Gambusia affinis]